MSRLVACLLLLTLCTSVSAREVRLQGANGDTGGACPDAAANELAIQPRPKAKAQILPPNGQRPNVLRGGGDNAATRMPRWHSFVPGMIR